MGIFLKIVSGVYLAFVWLIFALTLKNLGAVSSTLGGDAAAQVIAFMIAVGLSIPAAVLFGFGQIVSDIRVIRHLTRTQTEDLRAVRRYYEPR